MGLLRNASTRLTENTVATSNITPDQAIAALTAASVVASGLTPFVMRLSYLDERDIFSCTVSVLPNHTIYIQLWPYVNRE